MDNGLLTGILATGSGAITFVFGLMAGRKKRDAERQKLSAETESIRIVNLQNAISIYRQVYEEIGDQLKALSKKCSVLSGEIEVLREENISLKKEIHLLNQKLKKQQ